MKHVLAAVVAIALVWAFAPSRTVVPPAPPIAPVQGQVAVALKDATKQDKARVSAFYFALADVSERDPSLVKTVGDFRALHAKSLDRAFAGTDLPGKYPGLDVAINDQLVAAVGKDDVPLPPAKQQSLIQALKGVANAAR